MRKMEIKSKLLISACLWLPTLLQAGIPVFSFNPLTATELSISKQDSATVQYQVINNSARTHTLLMQPMTGITQITTGGSNLCNSPFILVQGASCTLSLLVNGSQLSESIHDGPVVCQLGSKLLCYRPSFKDILNISLLNPPNQQYTVGGTIQGLIGTVILLNNGGDDLATNSNGSFTFSQSLVQGQSYSVTVGTQPAGQTCSVTNGTGTINNTNITNVDVLCVTEPTSLQINSPTTPKTGTIPVNGGTNTVSITNTGANPAINVHAALPGSWTEVTQDISNCANLAPGASCNLVFSSTLAYIAQANIQVTGDNVPAPPTMSLAFTINDPGFLVWSVDGFTHPQTALVVDGDSNRLIAGAWGNLAVVIGASSDVLGRANSTTLNNTQGSGSGFAASVCFQKTTGGSATDVWYLPAICQLGINNPGFPGINCPANFSNINTNLVLKGFTLYGILNPRISWSSTENDANSAFSEDFSLNSITSTFKPVSRYVLCVRSFIVS